MGSCKLQGINAHEYVQDVLQRLPDHPINQLKELLPPFWKKSNISPVPEI
ncbi:transposase domain-containing protein [Rhodocytophaga aerolata]|uniref:Transposase domain-containing protein n=1 Tax=Rhodocytophaga aerolata TaxID=455078 RepID=A0ABT8RHD8_9BACT|nr:transposase domain-containing protein [Rhodocytophaga aerolata]MDO1451516.1 transposase domain-containing protein [Rhodocytophaga aerolata]